MAGLYGHYALSATFIDKIRRQAVAVSNYRVEADLFLDSTPVYAKAFEKQQENACTQKLAKGRLLACARDCKGTAKSSYGGPSRHRPFAQSDPAVAGLFWDSALRIKLVLPASYSFQKVGVIAVRRLVDSETGLKAHAWHEVIDEAGNLYIIHWCPD